MSRKFGAKTAKRASRSPLPRCVTKSTRDDGILCEFDVKVLESSRLLAKVLILKNATAMSRVLKRLFGMAPSRGSMACVMETSFTDDLPHGGVVRVVDPRYVCVVAFVRKHLTMEVLAHEAVHVGYSYSERLPRKRWPDVETWPEESVSYPAGLFAAGLTEGLVKRGFDDITTR